MSHSYNGLSLLSDTVHQSLDDNDVMSILKTIFATVAYADGYHILLAESVQELPAALHGTRRYCNTWKLESKY